MTVARYCRVKKKTCSFGLENEVAGSNITYSGLWIWRRKLVSEKFLE